MGGLSRDRPSWGGEIDGEIGRGVAAAFARVKRCKESDKSQWAGVVVVAVLWLLSMNGGGSP